MLQAGAMISGIRLRAINTTLRCPVLDKRLYGIDDLCELTKAATAKRMFRYAALP